MGDIDQKEVERFQSLLKKAESYYPRNMETEALVQDSLDRLNNIDQIIKRNSKQACKSETEELENLISSNDTDVFELKENVDERLFEKIYKKWQNCLRETNRDYHKTILEMDRKFNSNDHKMNLCINDCAENSESKSNQQLEDCFKRCMIEHERNVNDITMDFNSTFRQYEKLYQEKYI